MTTDDALYAFRLRVFSLARELGSVRAACRAMGIHHSTYYRWKAQLERFGPEILRPRERRSPRMANATSPLVEQRVVALRPRPPRVRPGPHLGRAPPGQVGRDRHLPQRGASRSSPPRAEHEAKRLSLVAGYAAPPEPERRPAPPERHLDVSRPGEMVQMDCFFIGRLRTAVTTSCANDIAHLFCLR